MSGDEEPASPVSRAACGHAAGRLLGLPPCPGRLQRGDDQPYRLGAGDRVRVTVFEQESLTNTYTVDQSGYIAFPLIGSVPARGSHRAAARRRRSPAKLRNGYLRDPDVSVEIDRYRPIFVMGEVGAAGQYSYVPGMTVQKAIAIAGGFSPRANQGNVDITRDINGKVHDRPRADLRPAAARRHDLRPRTPVLTRRQQARLAVTARSCASSTASARRSAASSGMCAISTEAQVAAGHAVGIVCDSTTGGAFEEKLFDELEGPC